MLYQHDPFTRKLKLIFMWKDDRQDFVVIWRENHKIAFGWGGKVMSCEYRMNFIQERQNHTGVKRVLVSCKESLSF